MCGSADISTPSGTGPESSSNCITCHDGFTLHDFVRYRSKHNEANGEHNHYGTHEHDSDNDGVEGATPEPQIESVRKRQMKHFRLALLISRSVSVLRRNVMDTSKVARLVVPYTRIALGAGFLSAVADRFGLWGAPGQKNVAWGDFAHFTAYTARVNSFLPSSFGAST